MGPTDSTGTTKAVRTIPHQKLEIEPTITGAGITQWVIKDEDGTEFTFAANETTTDRSYGESGSVPGSQFGIPHVSAWNLTRIETVTGDVVDFFYTPRPTTYKKTPFEEEFDIRSVPFCVPDQNKVHNEVDITIQVLDSIKTGVHTAQFSTSLRSDALSRSGGQQEYKLDLISITTPVNGTVIRRFDLATDYALGGRLTLQEVSEQSSTGAALPSHRFTYNTLPLPADTSRDQDHWGYFNDADNATLVPSYVTNSGLALSGADREPDATAMKAGVLTEIEYPTGGTSTLVWEPHDYGKIGQGGAQPYDWGGLNLVNLDAVSGEGPKTTTFTVSGTGGAVPVDVQVWIDPDSCDELAGCPYAELSPGGGGVQDADTSYTVALLPGTYTLTANPENGSAEISVTWRELQPVDAKIAGGLRIARIEASDGMGTTQVRSYDYTLEADPSRSSGVIGQEPRYAFEFDSQGCSYLSRSATSKLPLGQGPVVAYSEVTVTHGSGAEFGTTRQKFRTHLDKGDDYPDPDRWPFLRPTSYEWRRGQLVERRERNDLGLNQQRVRNAHAFETHEPTTYHEFPALSFYSMATAEGSSPLAGQLYRPFEVISEWTHPAVDSTWTYNDDGSNVDTVVVAYTFNNPEHLQLTKTTETNSDGTIRITHLRYPADFSSGSGNTEASAITAMKGSAHIHSPVIERWVADSAGSSTTVYEASVTTFKEFGTGQYLPYQRFVLNSATPVANYSPAAISGSFSKDSRHLRLETAHGYDGSGRITQLSDARGKVTNFFYSGGTAGQQFLSAITRVNDGSGSTHLTTAYTYNSSGYLSKQVDEGGVDRHFEYDAFGRLERVRNDNTQIVEEYDYDFSRTSGNGWVFNAASPNKVTTTTHVSTSPAVSIESIEFLDGLGRPIQNQVKDGTQYTVSSTEYDTQGNVWREWKAYPASTGGSYRSDFSSATTAYYNSQHSTSAAKPYEESQYTKDVMARVRRVTRPYIGSSHQGEFQYRYYLNPGNNRPFLEEIDETGNKTRTYRDRFGFTVERILGFGTADQTETDFENDVVGRRIEATDPRGRTTDFTWTTHGLLLSRDNPEEGETGFKYDKNGNVRFTQNSDHANASPEEVIFTTYDFANRPLVTGRAPATFGSLNPDVTNGFETASGNFRVVRAYDVKPSTGSVPWSLFSSEIGGLSLSNTTGKLAAVASYSNGSWQASLFSYDNEGRISTRYTYTHRNGTTTVLAGLNTELTYTWDLRGEPVARQAKVGTEEFGHWYEYDARGLVDEVFAQTGTIKPANSDVKYTYRPTGSRDSFDYLGGPKVDIRYDIRERIDRIGNPWLTSAKFSAEYGYNWNSTIAWSSQRNTGLSSQAHFKWDYTYDGAKRLEAADYSYWNGSSWAGSSAYDLSNIDYDDAGNLLSLQRRGQSGGLLDNLTYSYGWNSRLTAVTDAAGSTGFSGDAETGTFSYSWSGKQTAATGYGVSGTVYDYQDRPLWLWQGGNQTKYRYDEAGNRISKQTGTGDAEYYLWDGATTVAVFTATNAGTITDHYFNLIGSGGDVFGRDPDGSGTLYYYKDLLGTIRAVADGSNALVESYDYDPWGVEMEGRFTGAGVTKDGFTGKERDSESGFDYFGARHYMPAIGRWTGPDPLADLFPEWSTYSYVKNNPITGTDPHGEASCDDPNDPQCDESGSADEGEEEPASDEASATSDDTTCEGGTQIGSTCVVSLTFVDVSPAAGIALLKRSRQLRRLFGVGRMALRARLARGGRGAIDLTAEGVDEFIQRNGDALFQKLGDKIGRGSLPAFERSRGGVAGGIHAVSLTLRNATRISAPFTATQGGQTVVDVYSAATGYTVRVEAATNRFVTLIDEATSRVR